MPAKKPSNAGRKKIDPEIKTLSVTFGMRPEEIADYEERRGKMPRGRYLAKVLKLGKKKKP